MWLCVPQQSSREAAPADPQEMLPPAVRYVDLQNPLVTWRKEQGRGRQWEEEKIVQCLCTPGCWGNELRWPQLLLHLPPVQPPLLTQPRYAADRTFKRSASIWRRSPRFTGHRRELWSCLQVNIHQPLCLQMCHFAKLCECEVAETPQELRVQSSEFRVQSPEGNTPLATACHHWKSGNY